MNIQYTALELRAIILAHAEKQLKQHGLTPTGVRFLDESVASNIASAISVSVVPNGTPVTEFQPHPHQPAQVYTASPVPNNYRELLIDYAKAIGVAIVRSNMTVDTLEKKIRNQGGNPADALPVVDSCDAACDAQSGDSSGHSHHSQPIEENPHNGEDNSEDDEVEPINWAKVNKIMKGEEDDDPNCISKKSVEEQRRWVKNQELKQERIDKKYEALRLHKEGLEIVAEKARILAKPENEHILFTPIETLDERLKERRDRIEVLCVELLEYKFEDDKFLEGVLEAIKTVSVPFYPEEKGCDALDDISIDFEEPAIPPKQNLEEFTVALDLPLDIVGGSNYALPDPPPDSPFWEPDEPGPVTKALRYGIKRTAQEIEDDVPF